jgi:medium-chain acyl-[acyl-carrier-protein] hydrolase
MTPGSDLPGVPYFILEKGEKMQTASTIWFPFNRQSTTARLKFFCFPYAAGNPVIFRHWQSLFPKEIEVFPVHLPGRGMRIAEPLYTRVEELIPELAKAMLPYLTKPFIFFGHSMGALVCFELARYLQAHYQLQPSHLVVSAFRAPQLPAPRPPIYHLPDQEFIDEVAKLNGLPQEILQNKEYVELFLPILKADFQLCETYQYRPSLRLRCPITALGGKQDERVPLEALQPWAEQTSSTCRVQLIDGDHFYLHSEEQTLVELLKNTCQYYL